MHQQNFLVIVQSLISNHRRQLKIENAFQAIKFNLNRQVSEFEETFDSLFSLEFEPLDWLVLIAEKVLKRSDFMITIRQKMLKIN